jgi:ABC-type sugar transport system ATPase subunit
MATNPRLIVFDEPTRGVDIGAKRQIYQYIESLAEEGVAILMISSELEEVLRLSDRVVVMRQGRVSKILTRADASEEQIMRAASIAD